jgi:hypothetical protein
MKRNGWIALLMALSFLTIGTACSSDDEEKDSLVIECRSGDGIYAKSGSAQLFQRCSHLCGKCFPEGVPFSGTTCEPTGGYPHCICDADRVATVCEGLRDQCGSPACP